MSSGLDVIILDDDPAVSGLLAAQVGRFHREGQVFAFSDFLEARTFCFNRASSLAIFVLDAFLGQYSAFDFLAAVAVHYPLAAEDTLIVTGRASDELVGRCMAAGVNHLLEKPIRPYALQFAIRAIASKYLRFAKQITGDADLARQVEQLKPA
ncbi:MAG: response regulator [Pseudomonadota bacterium]